jgi:cytochrome b
VKTPQSAAADAAMNATTVSVWDPVVRLFHWSLVSSFALAWLTSHGSDDMHQWAGYAAATLIVIRVLWGFLGTTYARFTHFVRGPAAVMRYLQDILRRREARHIGHNPAGGAMILALMTMMTVTAATGWMMTTDALFGVVWVETTHSLAAHGLLLLAILHVGGVVLASVRHRENLIVAMVRGRKRKAGAGDVA